MGKKSKAKAGGDFWDEDPDLAPEQAQPIEDDDFSGEEVDSKAPQEANVEDEFDDGLLGALKRNKKKKDKKDEEAEAKRKEEAANESGVQVKSKKEKEKEKKEREKAKKKAAAARKAASAPQPSKKKDTSADAEEDADADADADAPSPAEVAAAAAKGGKRGKKGKLNPALAAIQKQQAAKAAAEEAAREKLEAERLAAEEEEARLIAEEEAEEEARRIKREKKKAKEEELKKQGKFLTKKQREQQAMLARRREQLLASGVQVAGLKKDQTEVDTSSSVSEIAAQKEKEHKQREAAEAERKKKEEAEAKKKAEAEAEAKKKAEAEKAAAGGSDDDALLSDWEAGLEDSDEDSKSEAEKDESSTPEPESAKSSGAQKTSKAPGASKGDDEEIDINSLRLDDKKRAVVDAKREERHAKAVAGANQKDLRSPICAILGHVDTGKTKLLDNMRKTNVQEGEAGGITQQIGATYFPIDMIEKKAESMQNYVDPNFNVPGLLIIDTPGHESFTNLRSRGSSLCNIAILVVDIMHGFQQQTMESIRLLKDRKTPFVVALNKVDRIYGWENTPNQNIRDSLASQSESVRRQFEDRVEATKLLFAEQGFNSELYYKNKNLSKYVSIVPTSAVSGEGVPDLLYLLLELTTSRMSKQLMYLSELEATILEVKVIEGLGTTIDVVLSNGVLHEGDRIVLCGSNGPIATNVRALLTPQPARELRIKSQYVHHKEVKAALGVKISANDLEHAIAGSRLLLVGPDDDEDELMDDVMEDMSGLLDLVDKSGEGVCVQASTLGSLEALLDFLKDMKIPVMSIGLGPVHKRDVMRATTMLERKPEYAIMLCFDVKVEKDAELYANENNIKIFTADIIYHLFDDFQRYQAQMLEQRRQEKVKDAVFPAVLSIIQVINKRAPMIIGVDIVEGSLRIGTPIAIVKADPNTGMKLIYPLGRVQSMEVEHKSRDEVRKGQAKGGIAIRLDSGNMTNMPTWGRHISDNDQMYSLISRKSIDTLKDPAFRESVPREDWVLIKKLKPLFDIH